MATIHFIGGEKGGVGKSVVARLLAQYMIDHDLPFIGFDTDRSHGALMRYYADYSSPTVIDNYENLDAIIEAAHADPERRIIVDLAAQTHFPLTTWFEESGVLELASEIGLPIYYWNVMDSGKDCVDLLGKLFDQYQDRLHYVLVQNQSRDDDFTILEKSGLKDRAAQYYADIINIKRLYPAVMTKIDSLSLSFWAAKNKIDDQPAALGMLERQRLKIWLNHAYAEIDRVGV